MGTMPDSFTQRELIEAVARGWWDALDTDREIDWGDIADLCMYISEAMPSPATAD